MDPLLLGIAALGYILLILRSGKHCEDRRVVLIILTCVGKMEANAQAGEFRAVPPPTTPGLEAMARNRIDLVATFKRALWEIAVCYSCNATDSNALLNHRAQQHATNSSNAFKRIAA